MVRACALRHDFPNLTLSAAEHSVAGCRARCFDVAWRSDFRATVALERYTTHDAPVRATPPRGRVVTRRGLCAGGMCSATSRAQDCRCSQLAGHVVAVFLAPALRAGPTYRPRGCAALALVVLARTPRAAAAIPSPPPPLSDTTPATSIMYNLVPTTISHVSLGIMVVLLPAPNATTQIAAVWNTPNASTNAPLFVALNLLTQFYAAAAGSGVLYLVVVRHIPVVRLEMLTHRFPFIAHAVRMTTWET